MKITLSADDGEVYDTGTYSGDARLNLADVIDSDGDPTTLTKYIADALQWEAERKLAQRARSGLDGVRARRGES